MRLSPFLAASSAALFCLPVLLSAQGPQPPAENAAAIERGRTLFQSSCGFCHGNDATGNRAPDLVRSAILNHDEQGNLLGPVIRNGRPDKGMPSFSTLKDAEIANIVEFLHHQTKAALHSGNVPGDYPLAKLLTGNAQAGKEFFNGVGHCSGCHSPTGDLAGVAKKYQPIDLQQHMIYPPGKKAVMTALVTTATGERCQGKVMNDDEFDIGVNCEDGWYRSWPRDQVKVELRDPLEAHRDLTSKYTDADMHNVFAYLETLK
jgi:cytochrome c oxidase cbb3-type subunit 3